MEKPDIKPHVEQIRLQLSKNIHDIIKIYHAFLNYQVFLYCLYRRQGNHPSSNLRISFLSTIMYHTEHIS